MLEIKLSVRVSPRDHTILTECVGALRRPLLLSVQRKVFALLEMMLETGVYEMNAKYDKQNWHFALGNYLPPYQDKKTPYRDFEFTLVYDDSPTGRLMRDRDSLTLNDIAAGQRYIQDPEVAGGVREVKTTYATPADVFFGGLRILAAETTFRRKVKVGLVKNTGAAFGTGGMAAQIVTK